MPGEQSRRSHSFALIVFVVVIVNRSQFVPVQVTFVGCWKALYETIENRERAKINLP